MTTRQLLEQAATILHKHHTFQTRYGRAKRAANATCADFKTSPIAELAEAAYMEGIGKETESLLEAIRAELAKPAQPPITLAALESALVGSRVVPYEAVHDEDAYDEGEMRGRIRALYARLAELAKGAP